MTGRAGPRPRGPQRPDPAMAAPELRVWAQLMRRVHDELYETREPAHRPTVTAIARDANLSPPYVSECFSGRRRPRLVPFLSMVTALGGDPREWEPRWHRAWAEQDPAPGRGPAAGGAPAPEGAAVPSPRLAPLPGVDDEDDRAPAAPAPPGDAPAAALRRYPVRRLLRAVAAWVLAVLARPSRSRRDAYAAQLRRRLVKQVRDRAAVELGRAEAHHYLTPRFAILAAPEPDRGRSGRARRSRRVRRAEPVAVPAQATTLRALYEGTDDLVLLGRPGMGKTTQLAALAHRLAVEALDAPAASGDRESGHVPVYLRLDTYRGEPAEEWLAAAMAQQYRGVSGVLVRTWLHEHRLLPVLDGLDEVPEPERGRCVAELRRLRRSCPGMAVGCRTDEADLRRLAQDLRALRYAEVLPPSRRDVQDFLAADREALADVHAALEGDPDLWPLFQSPMMLNFIRLTYRNRPADDLRAPGSLAERRGRIFDAYTRECLRRERPGPDEDPERTLTRLASLARMLTARKEHVLYLDRLDLSWLSPAEQVLPRIVPNVVMAVAALGLPVVWLAAAVRAGMLDTSVRDAAALAAAMALNIAAQAYQSEKHHLDRGGGPRTEQRGAVAAPVMANVPVMFLAVCWLVFVVEADLTAPGCWIVGLAYAWVALTQLEASFTPVFQPVEQMRWTWFRQELMIYSSPLKQHLARGLLAGLVSVALVCLLGYVVLLLCPRPVWIAPAAAVFIGLLYAFGNQFEPSLQDRRPRPNEGVRRSVRFCLVHGFAGLAVAGLGLLALIAAAAPGGDSLRRAAFAAALLGGQFAVIRGFRFGGLAVVRHWTVRAVLAQRGRTPYRYRRFLDAAEQRVLLHRTDSGYFFPHRLLQLHLSAAPEGLLPRLLPPPP
ncbi:NACHT domain-containing protein [Streptomyces globosus]|uniref:NACHT domain-containing protein n=1 Tax=Streptomyces globosus TaxID=68209 RepID=UPI0037F7ED15